MNRLLANRLIDAADKLAPYGYGRPVVVKLLRDAAARLLEAERELLRVIETDNADATEARIVHSHLDVMGVPRADRTAKLNYTLLSRVELALAELEANVRSG